MHWASFWNHIITETEDATWTSLLPFKTAPCVLYKDMATPTDKRRAERHLTTEQSGKTCLDLAYRLLSIIYAYLAAVLTASAGRASPGRAQKEGDRACLRPESKDKAPASSSHTVWFSLLDKHSECWSMSHPQAAISALSRRPTAQLSLSLSFSHGLTCRAYNLQSPTPPAKATTNNTHTCTGCGLNRTWTSAVSYCAPLHQTTHLHTHRELTIRCVNTYILTINHRCEQESWSWALFEGVALFNLM